MRLNLGIRSKLLGGFGVVLVLLAVVAFVGWRNTNHFAAEFNDLYEDHLVTLGRLSHVQQALYELRLGGAGQSYGTADAPKRAQIKANDEKWLKVIDEHMGAYFSGHRHEPEQVQIAAWKTAYPEFLTARIKTMELVDAGRTDEASAQRLSQTTQRLGQALQTVSALIVFQEQDGAEMRDEIAQQAFTSLLVMVLIPGATLVLGVGIALTLASQIGRSVQQIDQAARGLAEGNLDQHISVNTGDELGTMAQSFDAMMVYQHDMAEFARRVAAGDLTIQVQPKGDQDVLGHAFLDMVNGLREIIGKVKVSADGLAGTSEALGHSATATGEVVQEVVEAINTVAAGAQGTSSSAQASNDAVAQLGDAINSIAVGASEQARKVQLVSVTATDMVAGVEEVASNAQRVADASRNTRDSAELGARAVRETVDGMAEIKQVVNEASQKVEQLGLLGEKIGNVVETIDDIAEQTNLLALNAAIEAARAGEHGRGFAVVADEVRKLAERSQRETRAIADLIHEVQAGTRDAVEAMEQGSRKVELGSARADEAGRALGEILGAVEETVTQVTQIATSAQEMARGARGVVQAMQEINATVEDSSAATEEMAAQAGQVTSSIEEIAAVAEQNSNQADRVSASAVGMSHQIEAMYAQAEELAVTGDQLRMIVGRFRIETESVSGRAAQPARRASSRDDRPSEARSRRAS